MTLNYNLSNQTLSEVIIMTTFIKDVFTAEQINIALELGEQQTKGILMDIKGHMSHLEGVDIDVSTNKTIFKSTTVVRTRYVMVLKNTIVVETIWYDNSHDAESTTFPLNGKLLLRLLSAMELVHA